MLPSRELLFRLGTLSALSLVGCGSKLKALETSTLPPEPAAEDEGVDPVSDDGGASGLSGAASVGGGSTGGAPAGTTFTSAPTAPKIVSFHPSASTLTEGETVTFSAEVEVAQGDTVQGTLYDATVGAPYGPFAEYLNGYSITVSWDAMNAVAPLELGPRGFVAKFTNGEGEYATASVSIVLQCSAGKVVQDGACVCPQAPPEACLECVGQGQCKQQLDACKSDAGCAQFLQCASECASNSDCIVACYYQDIDNPLTQELGTCASACL